MELALRLNCGFARVAIKEFSGMKGRSSINRQKRKDEFQLLFEVIEEYIQKEVLAGNFLGPFESCTLGNREEIHVSRIGGSPERA